MNKTLPDKDLCPTVYYAEIERRYLRIVEKFIEVSEKYLDVSERLEQSVKNTSQSVAQTNKCLLEIQALEKLLEVYRKFALAECIKHIPIQSNFEIGCNCIICLSEKEYEQTIRGLTNVTI